MTFDIPLASDRHDTLRTSSSDNHWARIATDNQVPPPPLPAPGRDNTAPSSPTDRRSLADIWEKVSGVLTRLIDSLVPQEYKSAAHSFLTEISNIVRNHPSANVNVASRPDGGQTVSLSLDRPITPSGLPQVRIGPHVSFQVGRNGEVDEIEDVVVDGQRIQRVNLVSGAVTTADGTTFQIPRA